MTDKPETATVTFEEPVTRGEQTITAVELRRPRGAALKGIGMLALAQLDYDEVKKLLPRISNPILHAADLEKMDSTDIFSCAVEIAAFLAGNRANTDSPQT